MGEVGWSPPKLVTHLVTGGFDRGVVLDLPQTFAEPFPLVGFSKLLLALLVGEEVFGPQECSVPGGKQSGVGAGGDLTSPKLTGTTRPGSPGSHSRFVGPEEEDLVLIGGGFDCSFWHLVNLRDTKDRVTGEGREPRGSSDPQDIPPPPPLSYGWAQLRNRKAVWRQSWHQAVSRTSACAHTGVGASRAPLLPPPPPLSSSLDQLRHTQQIQALPAVPQAAPPAWASTGLEVPPWPKRGQQTRGQPAEGCGVEQQPVPSPQAGAAPPSANNPEAPSGKGAKATPAAFYSI